MLGRAGQKRLGDALDAHGPGGFCGFEPMLVEGGSYDETRRGGNKTKKGEEEIR